MILPFPAPEAAPTEPLPPAAIEGLKAALARPGRFSAALLPPTCERDGHLPTARWRGTELRCFRCRRCGEETQP